MNKLKPFKSTPLGDHYKVKSPSQVTQKLIKSVDWAEDKPYLSFAFPMRKLSPSKPLRFKVSGKYLKTIHCFVGKSGVKIPPVPRSMAGITTRPPKSLAELKRLNRLDHKAHLKSQGKKAGYSAWHDYKVYEKEYMPHASALVYFRKGKFIGLTVHFKAKTLMNGIKDHLGWHLDYSFFTPAERRSAEYQEALWLKKTAKRGISMRIDPAPDAYYKFFSRLGISANRVIFERL